MRKTIPFNIGDELAFRVAGSGYPKGTHVKVLGIGFDEADDRGGRYRWQVKIDLKGKSLGWWNATWFSKAKK